MEKGLSSTNGGGTTGQLHAKKETRHRPFTFQQNELKIGPTPNCKT